MRIVSCTKNVNLGKGYKLITSASMNDLTIVRGEHEPYNVVIVGHILDYSNDSKFIIAAQRPRDSVPVTQTMTLKESEEAFEKSKFQQYWIINKVQGYIFNEKTSTYSNVYGPYSSDEYLNKRKEFGLPSALELKPK